MVVGLRLAADVAITIKYGELLAISLVQSPGSLARVWDAAAVSHCRQQVAFGWEP